MASTVVINSIQRVRPVERPPHAQPRRPPLPSTDTSTPAAFQKSSFYILSFEIIINIISLTLNLYAIEDVPRLRRQLSLVSRAWCNAVAALPPLFVIEDVRPDILFRTIRKLSAVDRVFDFIWSLPFGDFPVFYSPRIAVDEDGDITDRVFPTTVRCSTRPSIDDDSSIFAFITAELLLKKEKLVRLLLRHDLMPMYGYTDVVQGHFPFLQMLQIWPNYLLSGAQTRPNPLPRLYFDAPRLRVMLLRECVPPNARFEYLQRLVLHSIEFYDWSPRSFFDFLRGTPLLRILDVDGTFFFLRLSELSHLKPVQLHNLQSLTVSWYEHHDPYHFPLAFLELLRLPALRNLAWTTLVHHSPIIPIDFPQHHFVKNISTVLSGFTNLQRIHYGSHTYLHIYDWSTCPVLDAVVTLVVLQTAMSQGLDGITLHFPNLRTVHYVHPCPEQRTNLILVSKETFEGIRMTRWSANSKGIDNFLSHVQHWD